MEYVSHVLPALGENAVEQHAVLEYVDGVEPELRDPLPVAVLKADTRLAEVIRRAAESRLVSEPVELVLRLEGSFISVRLREVRELLAAAREENGTPAGRERFRMSLLRRLYEDYGRVLGGAATRSFEEVEQAFRARRLSRRVLKAAWPLVPPDSSSARCSRTATHSPRQQRDPRRRRAALLLRRGQGWSDADVPLLDEARTLLATPPHAYGHVIVDEAQDLTPMQLRMVARRARGGALTHLGDVAPATGPVHYPTLGRSAAASPAWRRGGGRGAPPRLPRAARDHGDRASAPRGDRADVAPPIAYRTGAEPPVPASRRRSDCSPRSTRRAAAPPAGLPAVIVPEELAGIVLREISSRC